MKNGWLLVHFLCDEKICLDEDALLPLFKQFWLSFEWWLEDPSPMLENIFAEFWLILIKRLSIDALLFGWYLSTKNYPSRHLHQLM